MKTRDRIVKILRKNPTPRDERSEGLSLSELVVVLACFSILVAAAVPNLHRLQQEWNLWGAARLMASSLQWARLYAVSANTSLSLEIDEAGRRFYWVDPNTGGRYESTVRYLPGRVRIVGVPGRPLRFFPRGNAAPAGTFVLQGEIGFYRVVVNPAGRIRVERF